MSNKPKQKDLSKFTTEELDILFHSLDGADSELRSQVRDEIYKRVDGLKSGSKKEK